MLMVKLMQENISALTRHFFLRFKSPSCVFSPAGRANPLQLGMACSAAMHDRPTAAASAAPSLLFEAVLSAAACWQFSQLSLRGRRGRTLSFPPPLYVCLFSALLPPMLADAAGSVNDKLVRDENHCKVALSKAGRRRRRDSS
jgi:hypothetical protein